MVSKQHYLVHKYCLTGVIVYDCQRQHLIQVFLPNLNVKQVTQVLHSSPDEAKASAAELFIKSATQPPSPFNGLDSKTSNGILWG